MRRRRRRGQRTRHSADAEKRHGEIYDFRSGAIIECEQTAVRFTEHAVRKHCRQRRRTGDAYAHRCFIQLHERRSGFTVQHFDNCADRQRLIHDFALREHQRHRHPARDAVDFGEHYRRSNNTG